MLLWHSKSGRPPGLLEIGRAMYRYRVCTPTPPPNPTTLSCLLCDCMVMQMCMRQSYSRDYTTAVCVCE